MAHPQDGGVPDPKRRDAPIENIGVNSNRETRRYTGMQNPQG
jgi:hypothetical protein